MIIVKINKSRILSFFIIVILLLTSVSLAKIDREKKAYTKELERREELISIGIDFITSQDRSLEAEMLRLEEVKKLEEEELARLEEIRVKEEQAKAARAKAQELAKTRETTATTTAMAPTRSNTNGGRMFTATAYDLSFASCGKEPSHPQYGITASGVSLKGKSLGDKYIAVDRNKIKLGSQVHIEFYDSYSHLTGYYTAVDTGGAIKGDKVDIFFGSGDVSQAVRNFGRRKVKVTY